MQTTPQRPAKSNGHFIIQMNIISSINARSGGTFLLKLFLALVVAMSLGIGQRAIAADPPSSAPPESAAQKDARLKWWSDARFGMFIHWGVYSVPAGEWDGKTNYAEWFLEETHMPVSQYEKYADQFNPTNFDARAWVRAAKNAGVKYIVITSKHHDGFAMYPTKLSDWSISRTPFRKRDPIAELAAACKAEGIHFCLYYTIMDWHSSNWGLRRSWNDVAAASGRPPDMDHFEDYMKGQLHELLSNYGPIGLLWFDGNWESPWTATRGQEIYDYVRSLQPAVIVNNRVGKPENTSGGGFAQDGCGRRLRHAGTNDSTDRFRPRRLLGIVHYDEPPLGLQQSRSKFQIHQNTRAQPD